MSSVSRSIGSISTVVALVASLTLATDSIVVSSGDTLGDIAAAHDVSVSELIKWNNIDDPDLILVGATLTVGSTTEPNVDNDPPVGQFYVVTARDTLSAIARRFGVTLVSLVKVNSILNPNLIIEGQRLRIRTEDHPTPTSTVPSPPASETLSHTIAAGETLSGVASMFRVATAELALVNGIKDPDHIISGRVLIIPSDSQPPVPAASEPTETSPVDATPVVATPVVVEEPSPIGATSLSPLFEKWAEVYTVPRGLLEALAWKESNWRPDAVGPAGHLGIAQLSQETINFVESNLLGMLTDPLDPSDGVQLAARYLRYLTDRTPTERDALAAWAQGLHGLLNDGPSQSAAAFADSVLAIRDARA